MTKAEKAQVAQDIEAAYKEGKTAQLFHPLHRDDIKWAESYWQASQACRKLKEAP